MIELAPERLAEAAGGRIVGRGSGARPERASIDSRSVGGGDLFFGLRGERADGGEHAAAAIDAGAWGVVVDPDRADRVAAELGRSDRAWVIAARDPLASLQSLARAWRRELGCPVVGITGSTGKTSVKDICSAILPFRVHASAENFNTEIGLPLTILAAGPRTELLVCEMAMRGRGQIAELCEIAEPDVGAITNVGPVHLELLGTLEAIAEAKAEIVAGLGADGTAVVPADAEALAPHLGERLATVTFGAGGDVFALRHERRGAGISATIATPAGEQAFELPFTERHNLANALCAVAIGVALDAGLAEMARRAPGISFSRLRGELHDLPGGAVLVNDCYNANPISMRASLDHLASIEVAGRRLAVLGGMAELGPTAPGYHRDAGEHARALGIDVVVGVGELARDYGADHWAPDAEAAVAVVEPLLGPGDAILVKGSRAIGLERFSEQLLRDTSSGSHPGVSRSEDLPTAPPKDDG
ncbi:MAG: UDP-N-acetylmuramoyl-tripeptide--D-alanyl-D-alanine ligase [Solirubrobacterales bacterium]|nr:UDP-N-acetylmuramoyl-tripeptide--D-alanyl-D-alanine ligase [Solirubrobacterales bacterium]